MFFFLAQIKIDGPFLKQLMMLVKDIMLCGPVKLWLKRKGKSLDRDIQLVIDAN